MGTAELRKMFGAGRGEPYSRQRIYQLTQKPTFPRPWIKSLGPGRPDLWREDDVVAWAEGNGFEIRRMAELDD